MNARSSRASPPAPLTLNFWLDCLIAVGCGLALCAILLPAAAWIAYAQPDPARYMMPLSMVVLYLGALCCGIVAVRRDGQTLLICLAGGGVFLTVILLLSCLPLPGTGTGFSPVVSAAAHAGILLASLLGGWLGGRKRTRPHGKHKKRAR